MALRQLKYHNECQKLERQKKLFVRIQGKAVFLLKNIGILYFIVIRQHYDNTYNDFTYHDITYNDFTYNDFTYNDFTYYDFTSNNFTYNEMTILIMT
jgi:hypothetical protein